MVSGSWCGRQRHRWRTSRGAKPCCLCSWPVPPGARCPQRCVWRACRASWPRGSPTWPSARTRPPRWGRCASALCPPGPWLPQTCCHQQLEQTISDPSFGCAPMTLLQSFATACHGIDVARFGAVQGRGFAPRCSSRRAQPCLQEAEEARAELEARGSGLTDATPVLRCRAAIKRLQVAHGSGV